MGSFIFSSVMSVFGQKTRYIGCRKQVFIIFIKFKWSNIGINTTERSEIKFCIYIMYLTTRKYPNIINKIIKTHITYYHFWHQNRHNRIRIWIETSRDHHRIQYTNAWWLMIASSSSSSWRAVDLASYGDIVYYKIRATFSTTSR